MEIWKEIEQFLEMSVWIKLVKENKRKLKKCHQNEYHTILYFGQNFDGQNISSDKIFDGQNFRH